MRDATRHHEELPVILPLIGIVVGTLPALVKTALVSRKDRSSTDKPADAPPDGE